MTGVLANLTIVSVYRTLLGVATFRHDLRSLDMRDHHAAPIRDTEKHEFDNDAFDEKPTLPEPPVHFSATHGLARTAARVLLHGRVSLDRADIGNWRTAQRNGRVAPPNGDQATLRGEHRSNGEGLPVHAK